MENLVIKGSRDIFFIPSINFNAQTGICELSGESYLEDTRTFYSKLLEWFTQYINEIRNPITMNIRLTYFNTSSSRSLLDILNKLRNYKEYGGDVTINWYYNEENIDIEEIEDYQIDTGLNINIIKTN